MNVTRLLSRRGVVAARQRERHHRRRLRRRTRATAGTPSPPTIRARGVAGRWCRSLRPETRRPRRCFGSIGQRHRDAERVAVAREQAGEVRDRAPPPTPPASVHIAFPAAAMSASALSRIDGEARRRCQQREHARDAGCARRAGPALRATGRINDAMHLARAGDLLVAQAARRRAAGSASSASRATAPRPAPSARPRRVPPCASRALCSSLARIGSARAASRLIWSSVVVGRRGQLAIVSGLGVGERPLPHQRVTLRTSQHPPAANAATTATAAAPPAASAAAPRHMTAIINYPAPASAHAPRRLAVVVREGASGLRPGCGARPAGPRTSRAGGRASRRRARRGCRRPPRPARRARRVMRACVTCSMLEVGAAEQPPDVRHHLHARQIADRHQIQRAVVELRVRADLHAAAEEAPVADRGHHHAQLPALLAVDRQPDVLVVVDEQLAQRRAQERHLAAEALGRRVRPARHRARESERRDVDEVARPLAAVVGAVADAPRVDHARGRLPDVRPPRRTISSGSSSVRRKSPPVPRGMRPISVGARPRRPRARRRPPRRSCRRRPAPGSAAGRRPPRGARSRSRRAARS